MKDLEGVSGSVEQGFFFFLASDQDSKYLFAEVHYGDYSGDFSLCAVDTEKGDFRVTFYNNPRINPGYEFINVNLNLFIKTLESAKEELKKFPNGLK